MNFPVLPAILISSLVLCSVSCAGDKAPPVSKNMTPPKVVKSDAEWRKQLSAESYRVTRKKGTERPHTGKYNKHFKPGTYQCVACGFALFDSQGKFDSSCGWPSFDRPIDSKAILEAKDTQYGMQRTEIICPQCHAHLGHVFQDGPTSTGLRYCVNSAALDFKAAPKKPAEKSKP